MEQTAAREDTAGERDDRQLAERFLASRSESAFRELYRRHNPMLYRVAWRSLAGTSGAAEDAVQEAWIRAVRQLAGFRWESSLRTWLVAIVLRCCHEQRRRRPQPFAAQPIAAVTPGDEQRMELERAVASLAPVPRQVLVLHDVEGYTHEEIGEMLGMPPGTAKSHLHRARVLLRARLRHDGGRDERRA
jgi:RNA polymerase sigma-70 factor (ECF subfamily)